MKELWQEFQFVFGDGRFELMVNGFLNTLKITAGALVLGIVIGILPLWFHE